MSSVNDIVARFNTYLIKPAILLVFSFGFFMFIYGLVEFLWNLNQGGENEEGKRHMLWGIIGMLIMVSAYSILTLATNTFGIDINNPDTTPININVGGGFN